MNGWLGKKRRFKTDDALVVEEIIAVTDTSVTVRTYEKEEVHDDTFKYESNNELISALDILEYK
jgi:hypothetical protein